MRGLLKIIAVAMVLIVPATQAFAERVLRLDEVPIGELDPHKALDFIDSIILFNIYDVLIWPNPSGAFEGQLAESWNVSADGTAYTFMLRPGIKFHDDSELNADDVVYSFNRSVALAQGYAGLYSSSKVEKVSGMQVRFTLPSANSAFLASLVRLAILNSDLVKKNQESGDFGDNGDYGQAFLSVNDAGTGPYRVDSHKMQELTVLRLTDNYFEPVAAKAPDTIRIRYGLESASLRTLMARGNHELSSQWHSPEVFRALEREDNVELTTESGVGYLVLPINTQKPPTDDVHFRRAMALAVDYAAMLSIERVSDDLTAAQRSRTALPSALFGYDKDAPVFEQNLEAARAELAKSKYANRLDEFEIELAWVAAVAKEEKVAFLLQQNFAQIGIKSKVVKVPWVLFADRASSIEATPHVGQLYFSATYPDPLSLIGDYHSSVRGSYLSMWWLNDSEVDRLIDAVKAEIDDNKREDLLKQLQRRIIDLAPAIYAYETEALFAKASYVSAPSLDDKSLTVPVMGGNFRFHTWSVDREQ